MYARYTKFQFDPADREAMLRFWETIAIPSASRQPGWRGAYVLDSEATSGLLRTFTLWDGPADFERYKASDEHSTLGAGIRDTGLTITERDGLVARFAAISTTSAPLLRITRARFGPDQAPGAADYWRTTGGPMMRRAPGCLGAEAYWAGDGTEFVLVAAWASREDAERFLEGPDHRAFGAAMDELGSVILERIVGDRIG
jgi:heme-degrading monooxygenase HmoA